MRTHNFKATLKAAVKVASLLLFGAVAAFGQQTINLTAAPATTIMPNGATVPMWGYSCGAAVTGSTATCAALNTNAAGGWSPVVITVPTGQSLTINLTNNLSFTPAGSTTANTVPTSLTIVGQLGGGLGVVAQRTTTPSPDHSALTSNTATWPIVGGGPGFTPPPQGPRVQSFGSEVAAGATTALTFGTVANPLRPGTYLIESGTHPSIQGPMGLYGILVVTCAPGAAATTACPAPAVAGTGTAYPANMNGGVSNAAVTYNADLPLAFSEIDPVQNAAVNVAVNTAGFSETMVWSGQPGGCGNPSSGAAYNTCYPPAVNYTPLYYMINGVAFNKTNAAASLFSVTPNTGVTAGTGQVLLRVVNAGLRMHVPAIVGSQTTGFTGAGLANPVANGFSLVAEDGNPLPGTPRVQNEVFLAAGKVFDVMINAPAAALPIYDRELSLSAGGTARDAGMLAYIGVNGATLPTTGAFAASAPGGVVARNDLYPSLVSGQGFAVSDASKGVIANDTNVSGVQLLTPPTHGIVSLNPNGTFTYTPSASGISVAVNNGGTGYVSPLVTIAPPPAGIPATATATVSGGVVTAINVTSVGSGYTSAPTVTITDSTIGVTLANVGSGYVAPVVKFSGAPSGGTTATATATVGTGGAISTITLTNAGKGYTSAPTVTIVDTGVAVTLGAQGASYTAPTVTISAPPIGGTQATATATVTGGAITAIAVTNVGSGYTTAPTVTITDTTGAGASATATIPGTGATATVTFPGTGTGATATATVFTGGFQTSDSFSYCANGTVTAGVCSSNISASVALGAQTVLGGITAHARAYTANTAQYFALKAPGVLGTQYDTTVPSLPDTDSAGYPLSIVTSPTPTFTGGTLLMDAEGGFTASIPAPCTTAGGCTYGFTYTAKNSVGTTGSAPVTITFPQASNLQVTVLDGYDHTTQITDYRWLVEEDRTFYNNPNCTTNVGATGTTPTGCPPQTSTAGVPPILGVNFHTSNMPYVAQGCTGPLSCEGGQTVVDNGTPCVTPGVPAGCSATAGTHIPAVCDVGDGVCRPDTTGNGFAAVLPSAVHLDPSKRYYISVFPGDAADPFNAAYGGIPCGQPGAPPATAPVGQPTCSIGHGMGGSPIAAACVQTSGAAPCTGTFAPVTILSQPSPYPTALLSIFVFEDDFPLNGEHDSSGGTGAVNTNNEPGLGGFQIQLWDAFGGNGDFTGQMGFDMFNQPLTNGLAGQIDPTTGKDACPIVATPRDPKDPTSTGITGMIVTCPEFEADGVTASPLAGQALVEGLMQGRWGVIAHPGADRIARGEEWLQTNTLDGQKAHDSFTKIGEPSYFQEFGPAGHHVSIGFANPAIINSRHAGVCGGTDPNFPAGAINCNNTLKGRITGERLSRTPDERLYSSGSHDAFAWTQCYVSFGDPDGEDFSFTKCDADGNWTLTGLPDGDWRVTTFDQWDDQLVDGLSTPVRLSAGASAATTNMGDLAATQWQANLMTRTFIDDDNSGVPTPTSTGIPFANVAIRLRDGSLANLSLADFAGVAPFNETFPLFSWYTVETDVTRYKNTGVHVVYDVGGPADGSTSCGTPGTGANGYPPCGPAPHTISQHLANTAEVVSVPLALRVPGAVYCANADCAGYHMDDTAGGGPTASAPPSSCTTTTATPPVTTCSTLLSSGRIDPPSVGVEGWQGFTGQFNFMEFGKRPYAAATATTPAETGGIHGHVEFASTRPFDDPQMLVQVQWAPLVANVTINLYQEGVAADNVTPTLKLVDTTKTSSWDNWAQGFRSDGIPNMNCPGQGAATGPIPDLFFFTLQGQPNYLDYYNNVLHGTGAAPTALPNNSQFKCYDGMHNWNQIQPAPYDGLYSFPSVTSTDPATGRPTGTNCTACIANPDTTDHFRVGTPMLPAGKYVVEIVLPPGYELVKEEDKDILIGDNYIAPTTQQFGGLGSVFIMPDQATVAAWWGQGYNANNPQNPTTSLGTSASNNIVPSFVPEPTWPCVGEARIVPDFMSIFPQSGEVAPFAGALRNLCDRKEVTLSPQTSASAKFFIFTSTEIASKFQGGITDDYTSEFDPFSPTFGEKFSPPDMPISIKDWAGNEISRVYADHFGSYNGMVYSSWEVNPPNPTGYGPGMFTFCMNDPGPVMDSRAQILSPTGTLIANPSLGKMVTDPLFTEGYSQFCYELPFMPGATAYLDTPVVPTSAFAGVGYNNVDCYYPDATPAVSEVDGDGLGPWVSASGNTLTIHALGDQMVPNNAYTGPRATASPYNQKFIRRHYGFGSQNGANGTHGSVTIGGIPATVTSWTDPQIVVTVPSGVAACPVQQQAIYAGAGASATQCGELVINTSASISGGNVTGVSVTPPPTGNRGGTYTGTPPTAPTVSFAGGGGTGAVATAVLGPATGSVASVTVTPPGGSGYTANFTVTFTGGGTGTGAHGTATVRRRVTGVTITTNATHVYTSRPAVAFSGGGCTTTPVATAVMSNNTAGTGTVTGINITNAGNCALTGTITVAFTGGGSTTSNRTSGTATMTGFVASVTMTGAANSGGSGYSSAPTPVFPTPTGGTAAAGTSTLSASRTATVVSVTVNNGGSGYTSAPTVTFSGSTATRAVGTATINGPAITISGKQSIDTVTVTIGGKTPTHVAPSASVQAAIDAATPGDMIIVDPTCLTTATGATQTCPSAGGATGVTYTTAAHNEMLIMWKPVRLQGVGAATSVINANAHPAGKIDVWRQRINCLFGLALNGAPISSGKTTAPNATANPYDPTGTVACDSSFGYGFHPYDESGTGVAGSNPQVDRFPLEAVVGWNAELNGNLAELLQEPSLMGALEGAGITVLSKGVVFPSDPYDNTLLAGFPAGTTLLQNTLSNPNGAQCLVNGTNPYPSNYSCNPSSIDALGITDSSQGGGGIFIHGWGHNLQVGNNRIYNNAGTLSGGINVGQGEFGPSYLQGAGLLNAPPGSCEESPVPNAILPYCENVNVNIHNNYVALNSSTGDELFSATPAGAGGVSICTGSDYYKFNYNWVCGNLSTGDGGGVGHIGFSYNGDIEHNAIIFNQSSNPTIPANGGGLFIAGAPDADLLCNQITNPNAIDQDCAPFGAPGGNSNNTAASGVSPSDGVGPGLVINANLIMGNTAESGTGAGIAFQAVNGTDIISFPTDPGQWNSVLVTNNIIVDNVAGWDGGGISLYDSPNVNIINNTVAFNNSTGSAGMLFNTLGAPLSSQGGSNGAASQACNASSTTTCPQVAGLAALQHSAVLRANMPASGVICPAGHFQTTAANGSCTQVSYPKLENNIFWQNSSYYIGVGALSPQFQQNVVSLHNAFTGAAPASQTTTGQCVAASYWDIGVRGDTGPTNHSSTVTLTASDSVLTSGASAVLGGGNASGNPNFVSQYCNGSRVPPEAGSTQAPGTAFGWNVPPGIADATVPNPIFNLTPAATVDEGNNWVNMRYGPLSLTNPTAIAGANGNYGGGLPLGDYRITSAASSAANRVSGGGTNLADAPRYDFFNTVRMTDPASGGPIDAGAVEFVPATSTAGGNSQFTLSASLLDFGFVPVHSPTTVDHDLQVINTGSVPLSFGDNGVLSCAGVTAGTCNLASFAQQLPPFSTCAGAILAPGQSCVINIEFRPTSTSHAVRNANLLVTAGGVTQAVALTGHDTFGTLYIAPPGGATPAPGANNAPVTATQTIPALNPATPSTVAVTATITLTDTQNPCLATPCPAGSNVDAGPVLIAPIPVAGVNNITGLTLTPLTGTGTWALGGTCAAGTAINAGGTLTPPAAGSSCTITLTYTPPLGATGAALHGTARLTVTGYGLDPTTTFINAVYNAN